MSMEESHVPGCWAAEEADAPSKEEASSEAASAFFAAASSEEAAAAVAENVHSASGAAGCTAGLVLWKPEGLATLG